MSDLRLRPLEPRDRADVSKIFWDTMALGQPLPFELAAGSAYEELAQAFFVGPACAHHGRVLVDGDDRVAGYVLVTDDLDALESFQRRAAVKYAAGVARAAASGRLDRQSAAFHRLRFLDGWYSLREAPSPPQPVVGHFNIERGRRAFPAGRLLTDHIDQVAREAGAEGWFGEMNAFTGKRTPALSRVGWSLVHRMPNLTLSWLRGRPVERFTAVRIPGTHVDRFGQAEG